MSARLDLGTDQERVMSIESHESRLFQKGRKVNI